MIHIGFTGDFLPRLRLAEFHLQGQDSRLLFDEVSSFFNENDLNVIDLEGPLTTSTAGIQKTGPHIQAHPDTAAWLTQLNCRLVATANNHFKDYGWAGMADTYEALQKHQIAHIGSGATAQQAAEPYIANIQGCRVGLVNAAENEWTTCASAQDSGCNPFDPIALYQVIQALKPQVDFIIAVVHGGHEHYDLPSPRMKQWYRFLVDAGAHAVVGHHPHIISGYEVYQNAPIFYSLGNFCFDWEGKSTPSPWNYGLVLRLQLTPGQAVGFEYRISEHNTDRLGVRWAADADVKRIEARIQAINAIIADDAQLEAAFEAYVADWKPIMEAWVQPYRGRWLPSLYKRGWLPALMNKPKRLLLTNLVRCEAHRDIFIRSINPK